jgi:hypothetical protein
MVTHCIRCYETSTTYKNLYRTEQVIYNVLSIYLRAACKALLQIILLLVQTITTVLWPTLDYWYNNRYQIAMDLFRKLEPVRIPAQKTVTTARSEINTTREVKASHSSSMFHGNAPSCTRVLRSEQSLINVRITYGLFNDTVSGSKCRVKKLGL